MAHFIDRKDTIRTPRPRSDGRPARAASWPTTDLLGSSTWPAGVSLDGLSNRAMQSLLRSGRPPFAPHGGAAPPPAHGVDDVLTGPGQAVEPGVRRDLDQRFAHDFSHVRVHTDTNAASSARALGARAYTVGRDVVFGEGQYAPRSAQGSRLLAHELTHVVQQTRGGDVPAIDPHAAHERAAAAAATAVTTHDVVSVRGATGQVVAGQAANENIAVTSNQQEQQVAAAGGGSPEMSGKRRVVTPPPNRTFPARRCSRPRLRKSAIHSRSKPSSRQSRRGSAPGGAQYSRKRPAAVGVGWTRCTRSRPRLPNGELKPRRWEAKSITYDGDAMRAYWEKVRPRKEPRMNGTHSG